MQKQKLNPPKSQSMGKRSIVIKNKQPSLLMNTFVETKANPYLDKLSLRNYNYGKSKANNCDLGLLLMTQ